MFSFVYLQMRVRAEASEITPALYSLLRFRRQLSECNCKMSSFVSLQILLSAVVSVPTVTFYYDF
jgi:hypothetical protein